MARKKQFKTEMISDKDGIRFATPEPVAEYRAKRLQCKTIADISCGIGGQALFFAKYCDFVYAIEIDPKKIAFAKKNARIMGVDNIEFIVGDALSPEVIGKLPHLDVVFSDPARPPTEKERSIDNLSPSIPEVMKAYAEISSNFTFEAPPQLSPEKIPFDCEREYMSLEGKLNRLNLYFGDLKKADISAVALPGSNIIRKTDTVEPAIKVTETSLYAYEPEECVTKAGLLEQLVAELKKESDDIAIFEIDEKRTLLSSKNEIKNSLFKNRYKKLLVTGTDFSQINSYLKKNSFGKVIVRAAIEPEKYWDVRNELENGLDGERKAHLFVKEGKTILYEVLDH
ncbi:methyltransferase domain-containing protein [Methanolobus vulcani]|uniref:Methyltransferase domain-containing protein n=1 Tax=Methanolobus vulcani TaxID=38026 RepID=A0A7Z8KLW6_9EURY|nr:methyltransferase domain-containing protein [Methanolobus vulcani]TQD23874.1 methyltransferase domain-containing protein [Methanolobus vulcani]